MIPADFTPYELTAEQVADGWTVNKTLGLIEYHFNGSYSDPAPGEPARRQWYESGQELGRWCYEQGLLQDPESGEPARRAWYASGQEAYHFHYQQGLCQDPGPGKPAGQVWHESGQESYRWHYQQGQYQDPKSGEPAMRVWRENGQEEYRAHYQRGALVPSNFHTWSMDDALAAENAEARTVWFDINGWDKVEKNLILLDAQPDPGNEGHIIRLYSFPSELDRYRGQGRLIICDNASLDLDGSRRTYAILVPASWGDDALTVMARSYGLERNEYAQLSVAK